MAYEGQCGSCDYYEFAGKLSKGYCQWYKAYYFADDSCPHHKDGNSTSTCYITTVVCNVLGKEDDCETLMTLRDFRDNVLQKDEKYAPILFQYDVVGPIIAKEIAIDYEKNKNVDAFQSLYDNGISKTAELYKSGNINEAISTYANMTNGLVEYYNIDVDKKITSSYDISRGGHGRVYTK